MVVKLSPHTNFLMNNVSQQQPKSAQVAFTASNKSDTVSFTAKTEEKEKAQTSEEKTNRFAALLKAPFVLIARCFTAILNVLGSLFKKDEPKQEEPVKKTVAEKFEPYLKNALYLADEIVDDVLEEIIDTSNLSEADVTVMIAARKYFADDVKFFEFIKAAVANKQDNQSDGKALLDAITKMYTK